jgi:uncharacterized protein DUF2510
VASVIGIGFAVLIIVIVVVSILTRLVNSMNKSIGKIQGKDRCVACKRRLKSANGVYASKCSRCGATQPSVFERILHKVGVTLEAGEHGTYTSSNVIVGDVKGQLVLTNKRLLLKPKGEDAASWRLHDIRKVIRFTDQPGFAVVEDDGERYEFRNTGKRSDWYDKVFAAGNTPVVKQLRAQKKQTTATVRTPQPPAARQRTPRPKGGSVPTPTPAPPGTPAGWLDDPLEKHEYRYWDGGKWTEHVSTDDEQSIDFL